MVSQPFSDGDTVSGTNFKESSPTWPQRRYSHTTSYLPKKSRQASEFVKLAWDSLYDCKAQMVPTNTESEKPQGTSWGSSCSKNLIQNTIR